MKRLRMTTLTVLASAMVLLTSCLGEGGSETSLYGIAGVVESQPLTYKKVVRISDGSLIYSPGLDSDASIQPGDCCLIDCGTAVTVDLLRQDGQHLGGVIFPGAQLMRQALYQNTQRIPAEESLFAGIAGQTTRDCVAGGTTQAVIGALEHICAQARLQLSSQLQCVITGVALKSYCHISVLTINISPI